MDVAWIWGGLDLVWIFGTGEKGRKITSNPRKIRTVLLKIPCPNLWCKNPWRDPTLVPPELARSGVVF